MIPAVFESEVSEPKAARVAATAAFQLSLSETSSRTNSALPPSAWIAAALSAPRSEMSASITFAPSRANTRACAAPRPLAAPVTITTLRSEEHTSELQSLMRNSYAVFCLKKKKKKLHKHQTKY